MKKNILLIVPIFAAILLNACTDEQETVLDKNNLDSDKIVLTQEELTSISFDDLSEIPKTEIFSMVTNFLNLQAGKVETRNISSLNFTIKSKSYLGKKSTSELTRSTDQEIKESIPVYELMVENGNQTSYALVSADERDPGILALFSDFPTKNIEIDEALNNPNTKVVLSLTKYQLIKDVEKVEELRAQLRKETIAKICNKLDIPISEYSFENIIDKLSVNGVAITRNHAGTQMPSQQIVAQKAPMCKITWKQHEPYNRACPIEPRMIQLGAGVGFVQDLPVPAGCTTVACIGIEACLERSSIGGIPMNWSYYKSNKTLLEAGEGQTNGTPALELERAGKAIRYIYDQLHSYSEYKYGIDTFTGQSVKYVSATASSYGTNYITSNFNYVNNQSFDPDVVLSSLNQNKPVFVNGKVYGNSAESPEVYAWEGHAFVIDGYMITQKAPTTLTVQLATQKTRSTIVQYYDMYWHINLGWGSNSSAYFKLDSDVTCTPEFYDEFTRYNLVPLKNMSIISHISKK